jgi:hypothetical protein
MDLPVPRDTAIATLEGAFASGIQSTFWVSQALDAMRAMAHSAATLLVGASGRIKAAVGVRRERDGSSGKLTIRGQHDNRR